MSWRAKAGTLANERGKDRVVGEMRLESARIGVEVEHPSATLHRGLSVGDVVEMQRAHQRVRTRRTRAWRDRDHRIAVVQSQRSAVRGAIPGLDTGYGAVAQEAEDALGMEGCAIRQTQRQGAGGGARLPSPAQLGRRRREHLANRVVELADAGEARRERDLRDRHRGGLDQGARCLGSLCSGQRERTRTELGGEQSIDLTLAVVQPRREPTDAFPIDETIGDEPHRPADDVGTHVPLRRARRGIGTATLTGSVAVLLGGGRGDEELDVPLFGRHCRAARPAIDPGGLHRSDEDPVEPAIAALRRPVALLVVEDHHAIVPRPEQRD